MRTILCGYLIKGDPGRPCVRRKDHANAHRDINYQAYKSSASAIYKAEHPEVYSPEKTRIRNQAYYASNKARLNEQSRKYHATHREEIKARRKGYLAAYRAARPETKREHRRARRAREAGVVHERYTRVEVLSSTGGVCYLCGKILQLDWHVDHVQPISRGGEDTLSNVLPACPACNLSKGAKTLDEYLERL